MLTKRLRHSLVGLVGVCICWVVATDLPAAPPKKKSPQNKNQAAKRARVDLQKEKQDVTAAATAIEAAKARLDQARDQASSTRHNVVTQHNQAPSLEAARKAWDEARAELAEVSVPVLDRLKSDATYQSAVSERDLLRDKQRRLPPDSTEQAKAQKAWTESAARVRQMERQALLDDPRTKVALETVEREESDLRALVQRKEQDIKTDQQIASATSDIQQAKAALASAQAHYADELRQLAHAQRTYVAKNNQAKNNPPKNKNGRQRK